MTVCLCAMSYSQTVDTIRYVHPNGAYNNDGRSWGTAKNRVQDAINDLREYLRDYGLTSGSVYIAAGTYVPTESTESSGGSMLNTSFKIYEGIHVYGGFNPDSLEEKPGDRIMANGKKVSVNWSDPSGIGTTSGTEISSQWDLRYKTILTGNHSSTPPTFTFDSIRGRYNTAYSASSYHVVWFATNDKYETSDETLKDHFKPLEHPASIDGCVISSGNASTRNTNVREHTAYGGGVYMVGNSSMRACIIERCNATMRGGGIYCDGGGDVEFCYIHTCQSPGVGVVEGYGGGVCIDYEGSIGHSHIQNCAARCGGGLMISHVPEEYPTTGVTEIDTISNYSPFATACVISNNTANAEGGGIYLAEGGTVNHCTVCANNCMGPDVTYYGRRHGRTGGIYVRNCGMIFNSVFWGNRCDVNNDIQFASVRQKAGTEGYETFAYHTAFMNHDITDWTGVRKEAVYSLDKHNMPTEGSFSNHPSFFDPTVDPNDWDKIDLEKHFYGAGVITAIARTVDLPGPRIWHLTSYSALDQKGVQWNETMTDLSLWLIHAHTDYGVVSNPYEPASTLGALVRKPDPIVYALVPQQGLEGRLGGDPIPTIFIDPNRKGVFEEGVFVPQEQEGNSWDTPIRDLGEGVQYFRQRFVDTIPSNRYYRLPKLDGDGKPTGEDTIFHTVQILVKEGTCRTVGPGNYAQKNIRSAAIVTYGHMRFYGGYPSSLTGIDTKGRNPRNYRSTVRCNVTGEEGNLGYENNSAHTFALVNADSVVIDGFMLQDANTHGVVSATAANDGGGIVVNNSTIDPKYRVNMVYNQVRNCVISNCCSPKGAGIYVNAEWPKANGDTCYSELKIINTVIRNCKAADALATETTNNGGIITANGRSFIHLDHCNIMNNVGIPFKTDNRRTDNTAMGYHGYIRVDNSMIYCNANRKYDMYTDIPANSALSVNDAGDSFIYGTYNMFDADLYVPTGHVEANHPEGFFRSDYTVPTIIAGFVPDGVDSKLEDDEGKTPSRTNKKNLTRVNTDGNYPSFVNPSRIIGNSPTGDKALYGGTVSYTPMTTNPCVNAAGNTYEPIENFDRSDVIVRNYGGEPDIGAIENTDLPLSGTVIYVTPNGAGKRDGSSWANAIAGNTVYMVNGIVGPGLAEGDRIDPEATCNRLLDSEGNPILTTNEKYNGGWGRAWFTNKNSQTTTTQTTHAYITGTNTYTGGGPNDHSEPVTPYWETTSETTPDGSTPEPWVAGSAYNPLYPYGEISGGSRSFWRANIYHSDTTEWNNGKGYSQAQFITACNDNGWINNTRAEKYVSGLQWAVEEAARRNHVATRIPGEAYDTLVQVWVGAGKYTDYKGYFMRDSVSVYGGFPVGKYTTPGMNERHALMSNVVSIPKAADAESFNPADYECILQISDINPKANNDSLDEAAIKYWDDDYSLNEIHDTETIDTVNIARTATYTWKKDTNYVTATYIRYADMLNGSTNVWSQRHKDMTGGTGKVDNYTEPAECGGVDFSEVNPVGYVYQYFGDSWKDKYENHGWELVYGNGYDKANVNYDSFRFDDTKNVVNESGTTVGTDTKGMCLSGYMKDMSAWQTMKHVPAGSYWLQIDLGAYYTEDQNNTETCVTFYILASNGDTVAEQPIYCKGDKLRRYEFTFDQPAEGDLTVRVMATPGVRNATPTSTANNRKVYMANVLLGKLEGTAYVLTNQEDDTTIVSTSGPQESTSVDLTVQRHRTSLRKRVLSMPDVCVPTYGAGSVGDPTIQNRGAYADGLAHTHRVKGPSKAKRSSWENTGYVKEDPNYIEYQEASWDGFTIRHGFIANENMAHGGGAGVNLYEGAHLRNSIVINNMSACDRVKGGGIYSDGATATIEGCFVLNNTSTHGKKNEEKDQTQVFAGGLFMYEGTSFNSLFANNFSKGSSGGVGFCVGKFYNNTIAYNTCDLKESSQYSGGAISLATSSSPNLFVANTIIFGNNGIAIRDRNTGVNKVNPYLHCYVQSAVKQPYDATNKNVSNWTESDKNNFGINNIYLNGVAPSAENTPFAADFDDEGNYVAGRAASLNDFRLRIDIPCVNKGTEEFGPVFYTALRQKGVKDADIQKSIVYQSVKDVVLPPYDVVFAKRIQDCQIDIGAYEFNAAYSIRPDTTTHPGQAIFYVTFDAQGGDASANSPANAACKQKLQLVLDAAGRYKYNLMTLAMYNKGEAGSYVADQPNKHWNVEVWLEGDSTNKTVSGEYADWYTATRSTKHNMANYIDNTLDYSFIIPHGIQVKGGYKTDFTGRDPLTYRTVLSGKITSSTGAEGNTFHVVTFTNDLFTPDETYYTKDEGGLEVPVSNQLDTLKDERHRAVLDGVFIEDGYANSSDPEDQIGGGAVVTDFAHIRNCVIQDNQAHANGGGLYLKPFALVSGTIIKRNTASIGGGVYIEAPVVEDGPKQDSIRNARVARIFTTTICENSATTSAGGMWFDNSYARVNSTALWHNEANDNANVSGLFARSDANTDYPFSFCAVESRRLEGQGNLELSPRETEGVRWDRQDPFNAILYYPIEMSSTLSRAGMTYNEWRKTMGIFKTLEAFDIAGVNRMGWTSDGSERGFAWGTDTLVSKKNDFIEIGARAINKNFAINVKQEYVMNRLYVMHTDLINSEAARALQDNTLDNDTANMYRQMGSCILNPFHRLGDAFDYIIAARKADPATYRNRVFEVFIEQGTYYPYHNAYGEQDEVRNNTFLVPEGIYVIGGVDSRPDDHHYGQEGYYDLFTGASYGDPTRNVDVRIKLPSGATTSYTINASSLDSIRLRDDRHRPMRDNNLNSVIEPWELERQTILSGNAVSGEDFTHVYHVITMHADSIQVGPQPFKFRRINPAREAGDKSAPLLIDPIPMNQPDLFHEELDQSILGRTTEFDGIQITGGYANHLNPEDTLRHPYVKKTYFRGGGIFVDGNWTSDFDEPGEVLPNVTEPAKYNIPIVVENCVFTNNMAGNGGGLYSNGGIYMFGCHFTQNYSQGPMTDVDQHFIPWTAGGCIATNAVCDVANTLFDNNEARRGMYPINVSGDEKIPDADARQGFGGCLSVAVQSRARVVNCHFMKNKAVAYPSIYNFFANNRYSDPDSMQFAFNTIFWGNEVFEVDKLADIYKDDQPVPEESEEAFRTKYKNSRKGVFHYDPAVWDNYERTFHEYDSLYQHYSTSVINPSTGNLDTFNVAVTDKLAELRRLGDQLEGLYFCSYRKTYGPTGMKPSPEGYLLTKEEQRNFVDPRQKPVRTKTVHDFPIERYDSLFTYVHGNNNTLINPINTATDGPNFKQPTFVAGIDGYMQNADWLLARMNLTTDQGWGHLKQTVNRGVGYYLTRYTGKTQYETFDEALAAANAALELEEDTCTAWSVLPVRGLPIATFDDVQHPLGAIYNWYSKRFGAYMSDVNAPLPIKDQYYMAYSRTISDDEVSGNMDRISKHPKTGETDVYIDIGIYEYQYVQLDIKGQEIDTMWVATKAKDPIRQDGLTWETPTTDLQTAIDRLMSSHNNHDKYVCFMGDDEGGTFSPTNVIDNRRAFIITSNTLEPLLPDSAEADFDYGVNSLTFLGGYSYDVKDVPRNPQAHPVVIEMPNIGTAAQRNQLFVIEDMTRQMVQANWQGEYTSRDSVVIPIVFDGITFINPYSTKEPDTVAYSSLGGQMSKKGGAAIYYRWQRRYEGTDATNQTPNFNMALHPDSALIDGNKVTLPKLTISSCIFMDNGARTVDHAERSPAVRIDHGGGSSLIVNTLFHSNAGAPVYARTYEKKNGDLERVPNDVVMVNITSALNDGHIRLESDSSQVHNSLIWMDDLHNDTTIQLQMGTKVRDVYDQWDKTTNKDRVGIDGRMSYNAVWGCFQMFVDSVAGDTVAHNHPLSSDNTDIQKGPGFLLPYLSASTSEQRRERSFRLNPSLRTHEQASPQIYLDRVFFRVHPDTCDATHNKYWRRSNGFKSLMFTKEVEYLANDSDLASKPRLSGPGMERGAYECLAMLQRVLYVNPQFNKENAGDGSSWEKAFGQGQLQNAIDAAAVYAYMYQNLPREDRKAYVYVKGTGDKTDHYSITARDGVYVYGSLSNNFTDAAWMNAEKKFTNEECRRFKNYVRAARPGIATSNSQTRINSIHITGDDFTVGFLLDGFVITNPNAHLATSPVLIDNDMAVVRNCLIVDNHVTTADHPVADVQHGLLYNCLIYNDSADVLVKVGANGLVLNNTIVAAADTITPLGVTEDAQEGSVQNNIACWIDTANCFAPYMTAKNPYTLPEYLTQNAPLAYQLHEHSAMINSGKMDSDLPAPFTPYKEDSVILFKWDRDVLGNPRKISTSVDMGALETWYVAKNDAQEITALTNKVTYESEAPLERDTAFTKNYGGNYYPHAGSVVYLMDSTAMTMQYEAANDFIDISLRPGFLLLKPGASFYGNGHNVQLAYVAAEKRFQAQRYAMTAMPFNYSVENITVTAYDAEKDSLGHILSPFAFNTYQYDGAARSAKDYVFQTENSTLWQKIDTLNRTANDGYLMDFGETRDTVLRFNAFASTSGQYVYTEGDALDKYIYLTQYDHRTAGSGESLNFTSMENMGWNMKGLPWLVTNYRTDTILVENNYQRQMFIPHVFYQMGGNGDYLKAEGDKIYSSRSWDEGSIMSMGNAFFTQTATATPKDTETVVFHQPYYGFNEKASRPILRVASRRPYTGKSSGDQSLISSDILSLIPDPMAAKTVEYSYGRDGLKWVSNNNSVLAYLLDSKRMSRISLLGAAPTEVDIPLGVCVPDNLCSITFSLPEPEAFEEYKYVWLVDYSLNRFTNLLFEDYETSVEPGENNRRFAIRIGGFPKTDQNGSRQYVVYAFDGTLHVRGLIAGDNIRVYSVTGQLILNTVATTEEFTAELPQAGGVYAVRVNDFSTKVRNL